MSNPREAAHLALRNLWEVADERLRESDATERNHRGTIVREVETERGARVCLFGGVLSVRAEFEKSDGTDETVEVWFADDIRDLSNSDIRIDWRTTSRAGTNTPPLRDVPALAKELEGLI